MDPNYPQGMPSRPRRGGQALIWLLAMLASLRAFAALVQVPPFMAPSLGLVFTAVFIAIPIIGLFFAADSEWPALRSLGCLILGVLLQAACTVAMPSLSGVPLITGSILAQTGLLLWCFGLGALVAGLVKDKNLLLPIAIFLAGFDVFLVTFPSGPVQQVLQHQPAVLEKVAYSVPKPIEVGQAVGVPVASYVGPADFIFLSMFFVALFKFGMRPHRTLPWMVSSLIAYMGAVLFGPSSLSALPALLPIGLVILLVNVREFQLKRDEWIGTIIVGLIAFGLAWTGINAPRPKPPAATSPSGASPIELGPAKKLSPTPSGSRQ